jgi:hypothetical protein
MHVPVIFVDFFTLTDISMENAAGPLKDEAVSLRFLSKEDLMYHQYNLSDYQDTLYAEV